MTQFSTETITTALTTRRLGRPTIFFPSIGSTNDVARERAEAGAGEGLLIVADEQTAGRGRLDRRWWAPRGSSLLMSLLLRPPLPARLAGQLTMCLGLAAAEGIEAVTGLRPALKWPNDLLLNGRKLGGMLTELRLDGERIESAVLGLGVNVNLDFRARDRHTSRWSGSAGHVSAIFRADQRVSPPPDLAHTAISLSMALNRPVDRLPLLVAILVRVEAWYDRLCAGESPHQAWAARLDTLGRTVEITEAGGAWRGTAVGVSPEGGLRVRDAAGAERLIWSGDVTAVRSLV